MYAFPRGDRLCFGKTECPVITYRGTDQKKPQCGGTRALSEDDPGWGVGSPYAKFIDLSLHFYDLDQSKRHVRSLSAGNKIPSFTTPIEHTADLIGITVRAEWHQIRGFVE